VFLTAPFAAWLAIQVDLRRLGVAKSVVILTSVAIAVAAILGPFLELRDSTELLSRRTAQVFTQWDSHLPGAKGIPG
jgi:hypothetical protein